MPAKIVNFSDFEEQNTLILQIPEYSGGKTTGKTIEWKIPPLSLETEMSIRTLQTELTKGITALLKAQSPEATAEELKEALRVETEEEENPRYTADFWAPMVALYVKNVELDPEQLRKDYPGILLRRVGQTARDFFLSGALPEELIQREGVTETPTGNTKS